MNVYTGTYFHQTTLTTETLLNQIIDHAAIETEEPGSTWDTIDYTNSDSSVGQEAQTRVKSPAD